MALLDCAALPISGIRRRRPGTRFSKRAMESCGGVPDYNVQWHFDSRMARRGMGLQGVL